MQPSVGRIVHFHAGHIVDGEYESRYPYQQPLAAIITEVNPSFSDDTWYEIADGEELPAQGSIVRLKIMWPGYEDLMPIYGHLYPYSETPTPGHWTWPPRT